MEVLRARQQVQEDQDDEIVNPPGRVAKRQRAGGSECRDQQRADDIRRRLPCRLAHDRGLVPKRRDPAAVVGEPAQHDHADEAEDDVGFPMRLTAQALLGRQIAVQTERMSHRPARERHRDRDENQHFHHVAQQHVRPAEKIDTEKRHVERITVTAAEHGHDLQAEDREAPEDEEVHPPGHLLAHDRDLGTDELLLPECVYQQRANALGNAVEAVDGRCRAQQVEAPPDLIEKQPERPRDTEAEDDRRQHDPSANDCLPR